MLYHSEVLDRQTGELVRVCNGEWVTVTELGKAHGLGPRQVRQVLRKLGWVYSPNSSRSAYRLCPDAIETGLGKHIVKSKSGRPFDVISPLGQERFALHLSAALAKIASKETSAVMEARAALNAFKEERGKALKRKQQWETRMEVSWLRHFRKRLSQDEMAAVLRISKQLVSHHVRALEASRLKWEQRREAQQALWQKPLSEDQ